MVRLNFIAGMREGRPGDELVDALTVLREEKSMYHVVGRGQRVSARKISTDLRAPTSLMVPTHAPANVATIDAKGHPRLPRIPCARVLDVEELPASNRSTVQHAHVEQSIVADAVWARAAMHRIFLREVAVVRRESSNVSS